MGDAVGNRGCQAEQPEDAAERELKRTGVAARPVPAKTLASGTDGLSEHRTLRHRQTTPRGDAKAMTMPAGSTRGGDDDEAIRLRRAAAAEAVGCARDGAVRQLHRLRYEPTTRVRRFATMRAVA